MEELGISKEKLMKIKDKIIFGLLFLWMIMPILQTIRPLYEMIDLKEIFYLLMKITGVLGIGISSFCIYDKIKTAENKKTIIKEILPIIIFVIYMIWTLISCFLSPNKEKAFEGTIYRKEGYYMYLNYAGYFLCAFLLEDKKLRKILLNTFIISSLYLIIISRNPFHAKKYQEIFINNHIDTTVFAQFNHYGYYLMMAFVCCLGLFITEKNKVLKILYLIPYTIIGYAMIFNDTFGCYLAATVMLILYAIYSLIKKKDRILTFIAITVFVIISSVTTKWNQNIAYRNIKTFTSDVKTIMYKVFDIKVQEEEKSEVKEEEQQKKKEEIDKKFELAGTSRMKLWTNGVKFVLERPIIGYGPDNLGIKYMFEDISQDRPHNLIIYLSAVSGIPGMIIYVTAVGMIIIKGIKKLIQGNENTKIFLIVVITYLISSMFGNSMPYTSPYFFIFLGSLMNINLQKEKN